MQISQEAISPWGSSSANCVVTPPEMLRPVIPLDTSETACLPDLLIMAVMMMASMTTRCQGWLYYHHHDHNHNLQPIVYLLVQLLDHIPPSCLSVAPQIYIFHIYTRPKFTQIPNLHRTQIYTNPDLHGTHIYTAQIYTNPFPYIDSKKPKFTQPKFTQNPNLHNPTLHITQIYTKKISSNFAQTI